MNYPLSINEDQATISLKGKIYAHNAGLIRDKLLEIIDQGVRFVRIDLTDTTYLDSSGLGVLVTIHKRTKEKQGRLTLTGVQGMVDTLIKRTRLDKTLYIE